jgi:hypothetical protein
MQYSLKCPKGVLLKEVKPVTILEAYALVVKLAYHVSLSRRRSPVRIRSGAPKKYTHPSGGCISLGNHLNQPDKPWRKTPFKGLFSTG